MASKHDHNPVIWRHSEESEPHILGIATSTQFVCFFFFNFLKRSEELTSGISHLKQVF